MKTIVFYHADCNDGFAAATVAWMALGDHDVTYVPINYKDEIDVAQLTDADVFILDFSFPVQTLGQILEVANRVVWLDHHKSALEDWLGREPVEGHAGRIEITDRHHFRLDLTKSGAGLAWEYFFPADPMPTLIALIQDRDLWKFELPQSRAAYFALGQRDRSFAAWARLIRRPEELHYELLNGGAIEAYHDTQLRQMLAATTRRITLNDIDGLCANLPPMFASDAGHALAKESGTFGLTWYATTDARIACSLRSIGDFDVSALARLFGGGGHKNAAGFILPGDQIVWFGAGL